MSTSTRPAPFGRVLTAMVTPFTAAGELDLDAAGRLATRLVDDGHDGLVVSGTTGESPTTSDAEKDALLRAVVEAVGARASVLAGVGTNDTRHTVELARSAEKAGASGLLVVSPYYSRPPQAGLVAHVRAVADATDLPVMLYDIPGRTGVAFTTETLVALAAHPRVVAVKDAKDDLVAAADAIARTGLAWYSGTDALNLPLLSVGAVGFVSVIGHLVGSRLRALADAYAAGDVDRARDLNAALGPLAVGLFRTQGVILTKAALGLLGAGVGGVRLPLVDATEEQLRVLRQDLSDGGVALP
jgi:4-hydroxy-tetrahydrodipicolinate synthase